MALSDTLGQSAPQGNLSQRASAGKRPLSETNFYPGVDDIEEQQRASELEKGPKRGTGDAVARQVAAEEAARRAQ